MQGRRKRILYLIPVLVVAAFAALTLAKFPPSFLAHYFKGFAASPLAAGALAPRFQLESMSGETVSLSDFGPKPVLIKFWSVY